jgi:hypothetical protein
MENKVIFETTIKQILPLDQYVQEPTNKRITGNNIFYDFYSNRYLKEDIEKLVLDLRKPLLNIGLYTVEYGFTVVTNLMSIKIYDKDFNVIHETEEDIRNISIFFVDTKKYFMVTYNEFHTKIYNEKMELYYDFGKYRVVRQIYDGLFVVYLIRFDMSDSFVSSKCNIIGAKYFNFYEKKYYDELDAMKYAFIKDQKNVFEFVKVNDNTYNVLVRRFNMNKPIRDIEPIIEPIARQPNVVQIMQPIQEQAKVENDI